MCKSDLITNKELISFYKEYCERQGFLEKHKDEDLCDTYEKLELKEFIDKYFPDRRRFSWDELKNAIKNDSTKTTFFDEELEKYERNLENQKNKIIEEVNKSMKR